MVRVHDRDCVGVKRYRILVTGSRTWPSPEVVDYQLAGAVRAAAQLWDPPFVIVHGHAPKGADKYADEWVTRTAALIDGKPAVVAERVPADWDGLGKRAGVVRNREMVRRGASVCLAFLAPCEGGKPTCPPGPHDSHGASHCAELAESAGIYTRRFRA